MRLLRLSFAALILAAAPAHAQVLYGRVTDAVDGDGITVAQVSALDSTGATVAWTLSGRDGRFELRLPAAGPFRLHVRRTGFRDGISPAVAIAQGDRMGVDLSLRMDAFRLDAVQARARVTPPFRDRRARGFYDRMDGGRGIFYTAEQIAEFDGKHATQVITHRAGVTLRGGTLWMGGNRRGCSPRLYIDGFYRPGEFLDHALEPGDIWGIEIYRWASEIPPELPRSDMVGTCGIVMIWTARS